MLDVFKRPFTLLLVLNGCGSHETQPGAGDAFPPPGEVRAYMVDSIPEAPALSIILEGPTFTPFTVAPSLLNREEVLRAREREHPTTLKEAGIGGTARVYFLLDDQGGVLSRVLHESSGHEALDAAALRVAQVYRFSAALNGDEPVHVWVSLPISFSAG
jgi:TonB family protein